jgi:hypothetical protein
VTGAARTIDVQPLDTPAAASGHDVHDDVGSLGHPVRAVPGHEVRRGTAAVAQQPSQFLPAPRIAVDDRQRDRAGQRRLDADGTRRTARTEYDDPLRRRVGDGAQRVQEPLTVGVLADQPFLAADHAVHGADRGGRVGEAVEMLEHRDLVRDRAVEARPAHRAGPAHRVPQRAGRDVAVDAAGIDPVMPVGRLDHGHRRVLGGRRGERAGEQAQETRRVGHGRRL